MAQCRSISIASRVNVDKFVCKMKKGVIRVEGHVSETPRNRGAATRTRSKLSTPTLQPSLSLHDISSESKESPKTVNEIEMSSGLEYAREKDMCEKAENVIHKQIMRKLSSWDVLETVKICNKAFPDDAFPLDDLVNLGGEDVQIKSPKGSAHDDE
ncbi:hypothetical protein AgCh_021990 [Apium graveolens]